MIDTSEITAGVLSGGQGSRLGGKDKGLISCANRPFVRYVHETMAANVAQFLLSANRNLPDYREIGFTPLPDLRQGYVGPLAGVETLLSHCQTDWLWLMPVDAICPPTELLSRLLDAQQSSAQKRVAVRVNGRENPVCALLHKSQLESVSAALDANHRSVLRWLGNEVEWVDFHQEENQWIWSVNTPQQLAKATDKLTKRAG